MAKANDFSLTGTAIIESALRKLGILEAGASMSASQSTDGLEALNAIIKSFDSDPKLKYAIAYDATNFKVAMANATNSYDLHTDAAWIEKATIDYLIGGSGGTNVIQAPLEIITAQQYQEIEDKTRLGIPTKIYITNNLQIPQATIPDQKAYLWPSPAVTALGAMNLYYLGRRRLQILGVVGDYSDLPDSWTRYVIWQLAAELAFEYRLPAEERSMYETKAQQLLMQALDRQTKTIDAQVSED
jgi:hypothetical protein